MEKKHDTVESMVGRSAEPIRSARLRLIGATCPSCAHAIRHIGGKLAGVESIDVDTIENMINMEYSGDGDAVKQVQKLVEQLGYSAEPL